MPVIDVGELSFDAVPRAELHGPDAAVAAVVAAGLVHFDDAPDGHQTVQVRVVRFAVAVVVKIQLRLRPRLHVARALDHDEVLVFCDIIRTC